MTRRYRVRLEYALPRTIEVRSVVEAESADDAVAILRAGLADLTMGHAPRYSETVRLDVDDLPYGFALKSHAPVPSMTGVMGTDSRGEQETALPRRSLAVSAVGRSSARRER